MRSTTIQRITTTQRSSRRVPLTSDSLISLPILFLILSWALPTLANAQVTYAPPLSVDVHGYSATLRFTAQVDPGTPLRGWLITSCEPCDPTWDNFFEPLVLVDPVENAGEPVAYGYTMFDLELDQSYAIRLIEVYEDNRRVEVSEVRFHTDTETHTISLPLVTHRDYNALDFTLTSPVADSLVVQMIDHHTGLQHTVFTGAVGMRREVNIRLPRSQIPYVLCYFLFTGYQDGVLVFSDMRRVLNLPDLRADVSIGR